MSWAQRPYPLQLRPCYRSAVALLALIAAVNGADEFEWSDYWSGGTSAVVGYYLLGLSCVIVSLHLLLYDHLASYGVWKRYRDKGTLLPAEVLSCEALINTGFEISVLYTAPVHKFTKARDVFRHPDAIEYKRFLRRFVVALDDAPLPTRGSAVRVLLLPGMPKSGMWAQEVDRQLRAHSHLRTFLILLPGSLLVTLFLWCIDNEVRRLNDPNIGRLVSGLILCVVVFLARVVARKGFQAKKNKRFNSAVPMKITAISHDHHHQYNPC